MEMKASSPNGKKLKFKFRVFNGISVWFKGQLEGEIERGGWSLKNVIRTADKDDIFTTKEKVFSLNENSANVKENQENTRTDKPIYS